jgi:hypothetical protein
MAEVNVASIEEQREMFEMQMGFPADSEGLDLTDEQVVNFMLLCHKEMVAPEGMEEEEDYEHEEMEEEMMPEEGEMKVKVIKLGAGDIQNVMDEILGAGGPKIEGY